MGIKSQLVSMARARSKTMRVHLLMVIPLFAMACNETASSASSTNTDFNSSTITAAASYSNSIVVASPTVNQTVVSPVAFSTSCSASNPTAFQIYDGTSLIYNSASSSGSLNLSVGQHTLAFKCWYGTNGSSVTAVVNVPITVISAYSNTVSVSAPSANQSLSSPFAYAMNCNAANPSIYQIYDGSVLAYNGTNASGTLNLSSGAHTLAFKCWYGTNGSVSTPAVSVPITVTASNRVVRNNLQADAAWQGAGNCGNQGGCVGATPTYGFKQGVSSPSKSGDATQFYISGNSSTPVGSYTGGYMFLEWVKQDLPTALISQAEMEFDLYVPANVASATQAVEFEIQQRTSGSIYNMAWQADFLGSGNWRTFNYNTSRWEDSGLSISSTGLTAGAFHHVVVHHHLTPGNVYHDWISVDGNTFTVNIHHAAATGAASGNEFTNALQLDLSKNNTAFNVYFDNLSISYWH